MCKQVLYTEARRAPGTTVARELPLRTAPTNDRSYECLIKVYHHFSVGEHEFNLSNYSVGNTPLIEIELNDVLSRCFGKALSLS